MSPDRLERRLSRALGEAAIGLPEPAHRLHTVVAHGVRRRRWARAGAAVSGVAAASLVAVASAWAVGFGDPTPAGSQPPAVTETTIEQPFDGPVPTTSPTGETDVVVGTAPPAGDSTSPSLQSDETVGTTPPTDGPVPTTSPTGETDPTVGTMQTAEPAPSEESEFPVGTSPPTTAPAPAGELAACPAFGEIIQGWGTERTGSRLHQGVDVAAPTGDQVMAVDSGTVRLRTTVLGGNTVYLAAEDGDVYVYSHLDGYGPDVVDGGRVEAGSVVGYIGTTGDARGIPHLHFEIHPGGGAAVDAEPAVRAACG